MHPPAAPVGTRPHPHHARPRPHHAGPASLSGPLPHLPGHPRAAARRALTPRRADTTAVIGSALLANARATGYRRIAAQLDRPLSTVRRWIRAVRDPGHVEWLRAQAIDWLARVDRDLLGRSPARRHPARGGPDRAGRRRGHPPGPGRPRVPAWTLSREGGRAQPRHPGRHPDPHRPDLHSDTTRGVDLWWSGKHRHHGGNIQELSAPDGWPLWTSDVRPGREHDTIAAPADRDLLNDIATWVADGQSALADLGYEGEADLLRIPIKKPVHGELTADQQAYNAIHGALRCLGERANSLLKTTFKALRRYRGCP